MNSNLKVIKVQEHFWRLEEDGVRSFLFEGEHRAMLMDTGFGTLPLKKMTAELTDRPVFVVNTHTDGDHTGCNGDFDEIFMHPAEMDYYVRKNSRTDPWGRGPGGRKADAGGLGDAMQALPLRRGPILL